MKQRVLVLGASGFIGKRVVAALAASDWATPISASRRLNTGSCAVIDQPSTLRLDATDAGQVDRAIAGVTGVVNCVAGNSDTIINSARALFGAAAKMPQRPRIVHLSSLAVYGAAIGNVDESTPPHGELSPYGSAKLEAERLATPDLSLVVLRPGIVYGPGSEQWSKRIGDLLCARRLGDLGPAGDGFCNLVYIGDTVEAILRALRLPSIDRRVFNLSLPQPPTWNEYLISYAKTLGAVPVARITKRRLKLESKILAPPLKIGEILAAKLAPQLKVRLPQPLAPSLVRLFSQEVKMSVRAAEETLGIRWTAVEEGLRQASSWYRTFSPAGRS
jgi:nucleoside-diphosphate-sugar epimerase